jgi:hypothetical protein
MAAMNREKARTGCNSFDENPGHFSAGLQVTHNVREVKEQIEALASGSAIA